MYLREAVMNLTNLRIVKLEELSKPWLFHVYECENCILTFGIEQAFEEQSVIVCPCCRTDDYIRDVCSGEMVKR